MNLNDNTATIRGTVVCNKRSIMKFSGNTMVAFKGNNAKGSGGAVYSRYHCMVLFGDHSTVTFYDNVAKYGGGLYMLEIILLCHSMEAPELTLRITMPSKLEEPFVPIATVMFFLTESRL